MKQDYSWKDGQLQPGCASEWGAEGKWQQVVRTVLMSKQGKQLATSCLVLAGSKLVRGCPKPLDHCDSPHSPAFPQWQFASVVHRDFLGSSCTSRFHLPEWMMGVVKAPQCSTLKQAHFNYPKVAQFGFFFSSWFLHISTKEDSVIYFKWSSAFKMKKKYWVKKKKWEFWNHFKIFKGMERDGSESLLLLSY